MKHPTAAAGPWGIAAPSHLLPGHTFIRRLPTVRLGELQAGSCTPNPPHSWEQGEERQEKQSPCPSKLIHSKLVAGDFWLCVPEEGSQLWERLGRPSRGCSVQCKMSHVLLQRHCPREATPQGSGLGGCFCRCSDGLGNVCAALGPWGKGSQLEEEKGNREGGGSPLLIRNFPCLQ